jgi:hypothetical protein
MESNQVQIQNRLAKPAQHRVVRPDKSSSAYW